MGPYSPMLNSDVCFEALDRERLPAELPRPVRGERWED
jgi:hypothetical protein